MSYDNFLLELRKAGLSVRAFAELLGMNPNSVSNYARLGDVPGHLAVIAVLVAEMGSKGLDFRKVIARVEVTLKKPRGRVRQGHFAETTMPSCNANL
jgi:predicted transcriptional regulator